MTSSSPRGTTGRVMRMALAAIQSISGPQYAKILTQAGLSRYINELPPDTDAVALTHDEAQRINETVYNMLGEAIFRLWQRNLGVVLGQGLMESPWGQNLKTQAAQLAPADRLGWVLGQYARMAGQGMTDVAFEERPDAWYLRVDPCGSCAGVRGAAAPVCAATAEVIHLIAEKGLGRRVRVEETTCQAMGAHLCQFAVYKS